MCLSPASWLLWIINRTHILINCFQQILDSQLCITVTFDLESQISNNFEHGITKLVASLKVFLISSKTPLTIWMKRCSVDAQ